MFHFRLMNLSGVDDLIVSNADHVVVQKETGETMEMYYDIVSLEVKYVHAIS